VNRNCKKKNVQKEKGPEKKILSNLAKVAEGEGYNRCEKGTSRDAQSKGEWGKGDRGTWSRENRKRERNGVMCDCCRYKANAFFLKKGSDPEEKGLDALSGTGEPPRGTRRACCGEKTHPP